MAKTQKSTHPPFSLRFSQEERFQLEREATGLALGEYMGSAYRRLCTDQKK